MSKTFLQLKTSGKGILWPDGEPFNLTAAHDLYFQEAMIEMQQLCELLQINNTELFPFCATYYKDGMTLFGKPPGEVKKVYTIANNDWETKLTPFRSADFNEVRSIAYRMIGRTLPTQPVGPPVLEMGILYPDKTADSPIGRPRDSAYAFERQRIYIVPWIQSNETVVVEWDGKKMSWSDSDVLDTDLWTPIVERAIRAYVWARHCESYTADLQVSAKAKTDWAEMRADMMWECRNVMRRPENLTNPQQRRPTSTEIAAEKVP